MWWDENTLNPKEREHVLLKTSNKLTSHSAICGQHMIAHGFENISGRISYKDNCKRIPGELQPHGTMKRRTLYLFAQFLETILGAAHVSQRGC